MMNQGVRPESYCQECKATSHNFVTARLYILLIAFILSSCGGNSKYSKGLISDSLNSRVSRVDLIIVGKLTRHDERVFFDTETRYNENMMAYDYYIYYDLFWITVHEVLKGEAAEEEILVKIFSFDQTQVIFIQMKTSHQRHMHQWKMERKYHLIIKYYTAMIQDQSQLIINQK